MAKKIRLTESELIDLLEKIVKETKREEKIKRISESKNLRPLKSKRLK
jgi:DNA-binding TFAR19-related protein (PDSD5 family)